MRLSRTLKTYSKRGAPFILRRETGQVPRSTFPLDSTSAISALLKHVDYFRVARDTTKCASAVQQCVPRRRSQLTTVDTAADTAIAHVGCNGTSPKGNAHLR